MRSRIKNFVVEFLSYGKKEFLKYSVLQGKAVNELGFLKQCLGAINSYIYFKTSLERTL